VVTWNFLFIIVINTYPVSSLLPDLPDRIAARDIEENFALQQRKIIKMPDAINFSTKFDY